MNLQILHQNEFKSPVHWSFLQEKNAEFGAIFVDLLPGGEGVVFVESELGRVVTQRLGSGRVLAVDSSDLMQMVAGVGVQVQDF